MWQRMQEQLNLIVNQRNIIMKHIFKCNNCNKYTMKEVCECGNQTLSPRPMKYSPDDKFVSYRRKAKFHEYKVRGLL